jgi:hypothetical protein
MFGKFIAGIIMFLLALVLIVATPPYLQDYLVIPVLGAVLMGIFMIVSSSGK